MKVFILLFSLYPSLPFQRINSIKFSIEMHSHCYRIIENKALKNTTAIT